MRTNPKSNTFTTPSGRMMMFSGLISRWPVFGYGQRESSNVHHSRLHGAGFEQPVHSFGRWLFLHHEREQRDSHLGAYFYRRECATCVSRSYREQRLQQRLGSIGSLDAIIDSVGRNERVWFDCHTRLRRFLYQLLRIICAPVG